MLLLDPFLNRVWSVFSQTRTQNTFFKFKISDKHCTIETYDSNIFNSISGWLRFYLLSRQEKRDCHLALPYYKMSGLSVTEVIQRNVAVCRGPAPDYGKGFLFFLKHSLYEETMEELSEVRKSPKIPVVNFICCYSIQYTQMYGLI